MNRSFKGFPLAPSLAALAAPDDNFTLNAGVQVTEGVAGADVKANDALIMALTGEVYPVERVESACWFSGWPSPNGGYGYPNYRRQQVAFDRETGVFYWLSAVGTAPNGLRLTATLFGHGSNIAYTDVSTDAGAILAARLFQLSNGNICVVWDTGVAKFYFAIYDKDLNIVVAPTAIATLGESGYFDALPLSGGGFAVCYIGTGDAQKLAIYSNAGAVVSAPATIKAWTGAVNTKVGVRLAELSDGNLAIALTSAYATSKGLFFGIFTQAGVSTVAVNLIYAPAGTQPDSIPEISALDGHFAIAAADTANAKAYVYSNAGALQGGAYSNANGTGATLNSIKLLNDGDAFYLVSQRDLGGSNVVWNLARIPVTGVGFTTAQFGTFISPNGLTAVKAIDGFVKRDFLVVGQGYSMITVRLPTMERVWVDNSTLPTAGESPAIIPVGDFMSFHLVANGTTQTIGTFKRWLPNAIIGVAAADASKGDPAQIHYGTGLFRINGIKASTTYKGQNFDFTAATAHAQAWSAGGGGVKGWLSINNLCIRSL